MPKYSSQNNFKNQFPKNLFANIANFIVGILTGIFLVPYFIGTLGVAAYGLIPLATSLTSYVTILTDALNVAVSRFLTVDLHRQDYKKANQTFNTALFGLSAIILLVIPLMVVVSWYAPQFFKVPSGQESEVTLLFLGVFTAFLVRSWSSNFTVSLFANNRLDLLNMLNILSVILQVTLIVVFFTVFSPQLWYIGCAYLISSVLFLFLAFVLSRRISPFLHINAREFNKKRLHELTSMGWWAVVDMFGSLLLLQIELIVVNLLFGATAAGEYAVVFLWVILLRGVAGTLTGVLTPMILTYYAKEKVDQIIQISKSAVKLVGLFIALPVGLICGFAPFILTLWVGPQFARLAPLVWVFTLPLVVSLCILPLFAINVAFNKVRIPGIITLIFGLVNVVLAYYIPPLLGWGYYGVAIVCAVVLTLRSGFFVPWYATKILGIPPGTFTRSIITGVIIVLVVTGFSTIIGKIFIISSLIDLAVICGIISTLYLIGIWYIGFNQSERDLLINYIPKTV